MKKTKVMCMFVMCATCGLHGQEKPDNGKMKRLESIIEGYIATVADDHLDTNPPTPASILDFARRNGIPQDAVASIAAKSAVMAAGELEENGNLPDGAVFLSRNGYARALSIIAATQDSAQLPFLEKMSRSSGDREMRSVSAGVYVYIAGTNAIPFIRNVIKDGKIDNTQIIHAFLLKLDTSPTVDSGCLALLYEFAERDEDAFNVKQVDDTLCKMLPGYSNSVQRLAVASRCIEKGIPHAKALFGKTKEAIEEFPVQERADLSKRFKLPPPPPMKEATTR